MIYPKQSVITIQTLNIFALSRSKLEAFLLSGGPAVLAREKQIELVHYTASIISKLRLISARKDSKEQAVFRTTKESLTLSSTPPSDSYQPKRATKIKLRP